MMSERDIIRFVFEGRFINVSKTNTLQPSSRKGCDVDLHERFFCLLKELEPFEQRLIQVNKKKKIQMRKEHENYREQPEQVCYSNLDSRQTYISYFASALT